MLKNNHIKSVIFAVVFIIGIIILMNSVNLGTNAVENLLLRKGLLSNYVIYQEQFIINYRFLGGILSILGGLGVVINTSVKD